jgi:metal-responsive CopG/Arc/MetJ family transcriptional regulator
MTAPDKAAERGRPISIWMTDDLVAVLDAYAESQHRSRSEMVVYMLRDRLGMLPAMPTLDGAEGKGHG